MKHKDLIKIEKFINKMGYKLNYLGCSIRDTDTNVYNIDNERVKWKLKEECLSSLTELMLKEGRVKIDTRNDHSEASIHIIEIIKK